MQDFFHQHVGFLLPEKLTAKAPSNLIANGKKEAGSSSKLPFRVAVSFREGSQGEPLELDPPKISGAPFYLKVTLHYIKNIQIENHHFLGLPSTNRGFSIGKMLRNSGGDFRHVEATNWHSVQPTSAPPVIDESLAKDGIFHQKVH